MTARRFANTCPDCDRWRCVCEAETEITPVAPGASAAPAPWRPAPRAKVGPPPAVIRARLAALREEFARGGATVRRWWTA